MALKVLIVCSYRNYRSDGIAAFIKEQVDALNREGIITSYFLIHGKGAFGYLKNLIRLRKKLHDFKPDIVHAHYGLSGLLSNLQRRVPVITTYHGSDINEKRLRAISLFSILLSKHNIFVSNKLAELVGATGKFSVVPCGVDQETFKSLDRQLCRTKLGLNLTKKIVLFSQGFDVEVKNYPLAKSAIDLIPDAELIELKGYTREEVCLIMNACDVGLMTSFSEGSPQFIKEAMCCNVPLVSTDVGDVREIFGDTDGCYITAFEAKIVAEKIMLALRFGGKTNGRERCLLFFDNRQIALRIINIYQSLLNKIGKHP